MRDVLEALAEPARTSIRHLLDQWTCYRRPTQSIPSEHKRVVYFQCGRGWGKNHTLSNVALDLCEDLGPAMRGLLASRTMDDTLETCVRGSSGLIQAAARRGYEIELAMSRGPAGTILHPSGAEIRLGSGDVADGCRGPNLTHSILDEVASWRAGAEAFSNIDFATRRPCPGGPFIVVAGTPHYNSRIHFDPESTTLVRGTMEENVANLDPATVESLRRRYAGSKLGRQELLGELIGVDGALVDLDVIHRARVAAPPQLQRIAVGVDPSIAARVDRDAIGIVVVGVDADRNAYVLEDASVPGQRIDAWSRHVLDVHDRYAAGAIVVEVNQGGDSNVFALEQAALGRPVQIIPVYSRGSKRDRAERVLGVLYDQGRLRHVGSPDKFEALERELTTWTGSGKSPDRIDALQLAVAHLVGEDEPGAAFSALLEAGGFDEGPPPAPDLYIPPWLGGL